MTLRFPYRADRRTPLRTTPSHDPSLVWPMRPLIPVRIIGPTGSVRLDQVLVDNGSVDTIFPLGIANWVGASLIPRPPGVQWNIR